MYQLCIDATDKMVGKIYFFDATSGEIMCVEGSEIDFEALAMIE